MLAQVAAIVAMNLRAIPSRAGASLVIVVGMAAVVGVVLSVLSMSVGFLTMVKGTGHEDRAIILGKGAGGEGQSAVSRSDSITLLDLPGLKQDADGKVIASAEATSFLAVVKKTDGLNAYLLLRGVGPMNAALRPEIRLAEGRMFKSGAREVIVGRAAQSQFEDLAIGQSVGLPDGDWAIVGSFEAGGGTHDSGLLADSETMLSAYRQNAFRSMTVQLDGPQSLQTLTDAIAANPALSVEAKRETDYYATQGQALNDFLTMIAWSVGGIMAVGAVFGALNTMYAAVSARTREIATLRAIGFGSSGVVLSVLAEAAVLALLGGLLGAAGAWAIFNGSLHSSAGLVFTLQVTPGLVGTGMALALLVGLLGSLFPAIRAARLPVATALQAT